jgi:hypothetical protein
MQHDGEQAKELQKHAVENSERDLDRILGNTAYGDSELRKGLASLDAEFMVKVPSGLQNRHFSATLLISDDAPHHDEQPAIEARHCAAKCGPHR